MKNRSNFLLNLAGLFLVMALSFICFGEWKKAEAKDNGNLEYKTLHSYEEIMDYIEGDDYFYIWNYEEHKNDENPIDKIEETWSFEVTEPGWFMVSLYTNNHWKGDYDLLPFVFSNKLMSKGVKRYELGGSFYSDLTGDTYSYRRCFAFYLDEGTYYFKAFTYSEEYNYLDYALFLPFKDICTVDKIEYNDDYSEALVTFKYISDEWKYARFASRKNITQEALDGGTYWDTTYEYGEGEWYSRRNYEEFDDILHEGITLTQNGDYSIYYYIDKGEYEGLSVMVNFTIDKIGQEASKVQAKSLKMSKKKATLKVGENVSLKVTFKPKNVTDKTIVWTSSNEKVATVDKNGKVTAKKKGTCTITAISTNGKKAKCKITVKK